MLLNKQVNRIPIIDDPEEVKKRKDECWQHDETEFSNKIKALFTTD